MSNAFDSQPLFTVHRCVPGYVALLTAGDGAGAYALIASALADPDTDAALLVYDVWRLTAMGWLALMEAHGAEPTMAEVEAWFTDTAVRAAGDNP